ncbi:patatin-like phospholipase family protein [Variovorax sp. dw_954]|uniref:patatin-like phospholipase family protein n=1 Tax=Variovorax sp. dw_954 TaxID=2720078 RepID=UPI001BD21317|nr:patatin-like phospholipase family protein [Variovorax sp. dw_954]
MRRMDCGRIRIVQWATACASAWLLAGCQSMAPVNPRITQVDPDGGYRAVNLLKRTRPAKNNPETLAILTFSGGGTRAAAFSYGVLEELRRQAFVMGGKTRNVLDEVDIVAGVSGGSFTALAYALYGDRLFSEYERRFLKRNVQADLIQRALNPLNWLKLASGGWGRSELAADYYDEILFEGATFSDLMTKPTPATAITGTDISTGARFAFSQDQFDLLCSDLGKVRLSRAAATSSAVPAVLSPVTYANYGGTCGARAPVWTQDVSAGARPAGRALLRLRDIRNYQDSANRPYIHVVDGGVSDNLGLRGVVEALEEVEASPAFEREIDFRSLRRIVVVVVNSRSAPVTDWDKSATPPGPIAQILQSSSVPIDHFSYESVELLKDIAQRWADRRRLEIAENRLSGMSVSEAQAAAPNLVVDAIDVSFDAIEDPTERAYFMNLPTTFFLDNEAIDRLRALGGRLLRESPGYISLRQQLHLTDTPATNGSSGSLPPNGRKPGGNGSDS